MEFHGEIVFSITDTNPIQVELGENILPTKIINKDDTLGLGKKAPKNRWLYEIEYHDSKEYLINLDNMLDRLCERREDICDLSEKYEEVAVTINIRSDYAQIGYSLPKHILRKMSSLDCEFYYDILSFGMVDNE